MKELFKPGIILVCALLCACTAKQDWIQFRGIKGNGETTNAILPPLAVKWKLRLQDKVDARAFNPAIIIDDTIYFGSTDGNFYALDVETGFMRWVFKTTGQINSVPCGDQKRIYFGSNDGFLYALNREDGKLTWRFYAENTIQSNVTVYEDLVIFTSDATGSTFFLRAEDGSVLDFIPNAVWLYHTFHVFDDIMYFAPGSINEPHSFRAYNIKTGKTLWSISTLGQYLHTWYSFAAVENDLLYYATCSDNDLDWIYYFYGINRKTGRVIWMSPEIISDFNNALPDGINNIFDNNMYLLDYLAPSIYQNLVIYTCGDAYVRAFNKKNGILVWERKFNALTSSSPLVAADRLYFGLRENPQLGIPPRLICVSAADGKLLWSVNLDGAILSAPVISGKYIVFGTDKHSFYVLEQVF